MKRFKAVVFDLDNTLFDEVTYFKIVLKNFAELHSLNKELLNTFDLFYHKERPRSKDILKDILAHFFLLTPSKVLHDSLFDMYTSTIQPILLPQASKEILDYLKTENYKLGLLTNGVVAAQQCKVGCLDLKKNFDEIVYARTWGGKFEKPNPLPFSKIIDVLNVKFEDCVFVGDNPDTDFKVPFQKGGYTVRILNGPNKMKNCEGWIKLEINDLKALKRIL